MFDELLKREDVIELLKEIFNSPKYYEKKIEGENVDYVLHEKILFLFYDALYKYQLIIEDPKFFTDYLAQFEAVITKLNDVQDIKFGISKLICNTLKKKLGEDVSREEILNTVYSKYVKDGYYFRGINKREYINLKNHLQLQELPEMRELKLLLEKYNIDIFDSYNHKSTFDTDMTKECFNSINSPLYLYSLVCDNSYLPKKCRKDVYYLKNFDGCLHNLNRVLDGANVDENDRFKMLEYFEVLWKFYTDNDDSIFLVAIKRNELSGDMVEYKDKEDFSLEEAVDNIFSAYDDFYNKNERYDQDHLLFLELYGCRKFLKEKEEEKKVEVIDDGFKLDNKYGKSTIFLIVGAVFVIIGVILAVLLS